MQSPLFEAVGEGEYSKMRKRRIRYMGLVGVAITTARLQQ
jgi:hypothetical protein